MKKRSAFLALSFLATLGFMLGSASCTSKQQAVGNVALGIAERRGYIKAQDAEDIRLLGPVLLQVDQTSSK